MSTYPPHLHLLPIRQHEGRLHSSCSSPSLTIMMMNDDDDAWLSEQDSQQFRSLSCLPFSASDESLKDSTLLNVVASFRDELFHDRSYPQHHSQAARMNAAWQEILAKIQDTSSTATGTSATTKTDDEEDGYEEDYDEQLQHQHQAHPAGSNINTTSTAQATPASQHEFHGVANFQQSQAQSSVVDYGIFWI